MPSVSAERVRKFRRVRKEAGLVELRIWVTKADKEAVLAAVAPYVKQADWEWSMRAAYGPGWRSHPKAIELLKIFAHAGILLSKP